jgi:hypothetical protein
MARAVQRPYMSIETAFFLGKEEHHEIHTIRHYTIGGTVSTSADE